MLIRFTSQTGPVAALSASSSRTSVPAAAAGRKLLLNEKKELVQSQFNFQKNFFYVELTSIRRWNGELCDTLIIRQFV